MEYFKILKKYLKGQGLMLFFLFIAIAISTGIQLIGPSIISDFIDTSIYQTNVNKMINLAIAYIALALINILIAVLITYLSQKIGWKSTNTLRQDLVKHSIGLDMSFHKEKTHGEMIETIDNDVGTLFNFFSRMVIVLSSNCLLFIGMLIVYFTKDYRMGILEVMYSIITFIALLKIRKYGVEIRKSSRKIETEIYSFAGEVITNTEDIKGNGNTKYVFTRFNKLMNNWLPIRIKSGIAGWMPFTVLLIFQAVGYGICFIMGTYLWKTNVISIGTIYLFFNYTKMFLNPINILQQQIGDLQKVGASLHRIGNLLNVKSSIVDSNNNVEIEEEHGLILDNVSFSYDEDREILKNINYNVEQGKKIALLGRTGSGKTTLASLIVRLYDVSKGSICLYGCNIKDIPLKRIREDIIYVTQDIQILNTSIRNNITFYNKKISDNTILEAINNMGLNDWFSKFENGLDTNIGVGGVGLSAGEGQLLAFVRAFIKNPQVVILDEVTSKLDLETESKIQVAVNNLLKDKIGIIIAHRIQTIKEVDEVVIIEDGEIIESGSTQMLKENKNSQFYNILTSVGEEGVIYA